MTRKKKKKSPQKAMGWSGNLWWENMPPSLAGLGCNQVQSSVVEAVTNQAPGICSGEGTRDIKEESQNGTGPFL